jgi:hypothetical protein
MWFPIFLSFQKYQKWRAVKRLRPGSARGGRHNGQAAIGGDKWTLPLSLVAFKDRMNGPAVARPVLVRIMQA